MHPAGTGPAAHARPRGPFLRADHDHEPARRALSGARAGSTRPDTGLTPAHALALSVLDGLEPALREFLSESSVLGVLSAPTCDRFLARTGSQALLDDLARRGLLSPDDADHANGVDEAPDADGGDEAGRAGDVRRYRMPPLLHEALAADLAARSRPGTVRACHARAGEVLEAAGDWWGAVRAYAAAQDAEALARLTRHRPGTVGSADPAAEREARQEARQEATVGEPAARRAATAEPGADGVVPAPALTVRLLGTFEIVADGSPVDLSVLRPRVRSVLQYLALHADAFVHRDVLAALLWPESDLETGRRGVQVAVSALRSLLQPGRPRHSTLLPRRGDAYGLVLAGHGSSDLVDLDAQLTRARRARVAGDLDDAVGGWREVARLYRGELLPEQGNAEWVVAERDRLRHAVADALEFLGRHLVGTHRADQAVEALRRALELDPFRDGTWRTLADTHEALGDLAAAADVRRRHRRVLVDLGVLDHDDEERDRGPRSLPRPR